MRETIVLLGQEDDFHTELVGRHLDRKPLVIDLGRLERGLSYSFEGTDRPVITYAGNVLDLDPKKILSVWYRKMNVAKMRQLKFRNPDEKAYALSSIRHLHDGLEGLIGYDGPFWVSRRDKIVQAERKPYHFALAKKAGFRHLPATIITSDPRMAKDFIERNGHCIVKPLALEMPPGRDQYTLEATPEMNFNALYYNPHIFQMCIDPLFELRVGVAGNEAFASKVEDLEEETATRQGIRDWRHGFGKDTFKASRFTLPSEIGQACVQLCRLLGLVTGYIDIIVDKQGNYWFIEINPNGEFGFMDDWARDKIANKIARILMSGAIM